MATDVGEVIRAVAEGATGGMRALRAAGLTVGVDAFDVEVDFVGSPDRAGGEVSATMRLRLSVSPGNPGREEDPNPVVREFRDAVAHPA